MPESKRPLKLFLCHASADKPAVRDLYKRLTADGVDAWLDAEKLLPGENWQVEIPRAIRNSDIVVVCLSGKSVNKEGYVQKEIKFALDIADEKPEGTIFIIPARLEECDTPDRLSMYQWVDLFEDNGYDRLVRALKLRAEKIGAVLKSHRKSPSHSSQRQVEEKKLSELQHGVPAPAKPEQELIARAPRLKPGIGIAIALGAAVIILSVLATVATRYLPSIITVRTNTPAGSSALTGTAQTVQAQLTPEQVNTNTPDAMVPVLPIEISTKTLSPVNIADVQLCDKATFVADVTIPDGTVMIPNQAFTKIWRLKNVGTCIWTTAYSIVFLNGDSMNGPASQHLSGTVAPGQSVDISIDLWAPATPGNYKGFWKLQNDKGVLFGVDQNADGTFFIEIVVAASPTATP
jgi:hypothetical protein